MIEQLLKNDLLNPNMWDFFFEDQKDLRFLVKSTTLPFIKFNTDTISTGQKYINSYSVEDNFSITFWETSDGLIYNYFKKWQDSIYNKNRRVFMNQKYTKEAILSLSKITLPLNTEEYTISFHFSNMLFLGFENLDWNYTGTERKEIVCNFSADTVDETKPINPTY